MCKILSLIVFIVLSFQIKAQTINLVGQSKKLIEDQCRQAGFKLFSDKENEQRFEVATSGSTTVFLVFNYLNGYCECQMIVGKGNQNESASIESSIKKHFCENWQEINSTQIKCGNVIANYKKGYESGTFTYIMWWLVY